MNKQTRLEALKLAVQAGGGENPIPLAEVFAAYIEAGVDLDAEMVDDTTPANNRRKAVKKD